MAREIILWLIAGVASVLSGVLIFMYAADGMLIAEGGINGSFLAERNKMRSRCLALSVMLAFVAIIGLPWSGYFPFIAIAVILATVVFLYRTIWKTGVYHEAVRRSLRKHKDRYR